MAMMRLRREDPRVVGSFRLHRRLGAGGMGVVYLGSDRRGQRVALKVIRPDLAEDQEFRSRFAREVSAARRIRGGCTARLVAADLDADRPWFATQYVPGPSLQDKVNEGGPLPAAQVASIGAALAEGLVAVHEAGVVHRDLKPSNILLSPKGPRIIDFGIAWATGASTLTHVGTAVGSPGFLSPEQVRGAAVTPATDVFALGATLAYAATADSPFGQGSSEVMLYRVVHEEPHLHEVHAALAPLVKACLVKSPEDRPSTLQLSLRLKEIAAREARGLSEGGDTATLGGGWLPGPGERPGTGVRPAPAVRQSRVAAERRTPDHAQQRPRRTAGGRGREDTASSPRASTPRTPRPARDGYEEGTGVRAGTGRPSRRSSGPPPPRGDSSGRTGSGRQPATGASGNSGGRPSGKRPMSQRPGNGRSPAARKRRLLRQRLVVFVTVTLLVALAIAAAQGCEGPPRGMGEHFKRLPASAPQQDDER
ncbi:MULTISPECIES: protein kinase domain-containing protein [unclassified Streptomyces]|uniref:serine/threonine protein kinase n=1 Tax=unclassified Streptomyces TaxID=2593676 RepID=UPI002DDC794E|nr:MULTISPECIES: protein kinase [unclassified Streptomyces]WSA96269.1 protein kinase [Streptomyces sp. NBC_01795]WSB80682.1 protein kinase [Streptomyces sp. NBC_01775]WSS39817.1 protein kinase [Streptomyces sp. NBC_01187]